MITSDHSYFSPHVLLTVWIISLITGLYLGVFRSMIDRIRAGLSTPPGEKSKPGKLLDSILGEPNHARPLHVEAALFSALQLFLGFFCILTFWKDSQGTLFYCMAFATSFLIERFFSGAVPRLLVASVKCDFHLKIGYPFALFARLITYPFSLVFGVMESNFVQSSQNGNEDLSLIHI